MKTFKLDPIYLDSDILIYETRNTYIIKRENDYIEFLASGKQRYVSIEYINKIKNL